MAKKQKSKFVLYLEYIPFRMVYSFVHMLPLKIAYALAVFVVSILYPFDFRHRRRAVQHLLHAGVAKSRGEAARIARKMFREFGKLFVEIVKMDQCYSPAKVDRIGSESAMHELYENHQQVIIVTAHYGNWEVAGTAFSHAARRNMLSIMRPFDNPMVGKLIVDHRASDVHEVVDKSKGIRPLLKALGEGRNISILIDQHASRTEGVETTFFGHPCRTHKTPALLHLKTQIPILPILIRRKPTNNFEFELYVEDLIRYTPTANKEEDILRITQQCNDTFEKMILKKPEQWMWSARRWLDINR